jgi:hypothetical protein
MHVPVEQCGCQLSDAGLAGLPAAFCICAAVTTQTQHTASKSYSVMLDGWQVASQEPHACRTVCTL